MDHVALDQVSRAVADWLFTTVIIAPNVSANAAWEVEAKLGHLIDQSTNERLHLPALTDFILDRSYGPRVAFRSTMTEAQHKSFNQFLNNALMRSLPTKDASTPPTKPRIPLTYKHTRQTDTFYDLPLTEAKQNLPPAVLALAHQNERSRMLRVRQSTDQRTGAEIARIVKVRVSDLDIHSPSTLFDVRISVNVEVNYTGSISELERLAGDKRSANPPRNKDRMTYNHLVYQIDLTQVTKAEVCLLWSLEVVEQRADDRQSGQQSDKEHELEVEIHGMDAFRLHGQRLKEGLPSDYVQMVNGFVDNIRLLQRHLPPSHP